MSATNADAISVALTSHRSLERPARELHRGEALEAVFAGAGRWRGELLAQERPRTTSAELMPRIFHITTRAAWEEAEAAGRYSADSLATEGFIHCSQAEQVAWVANTRFRGRTDLVLLHVMRQRWTPRSAARTSKGGALFPHIYGSLPVSAVVDVTPWSPQPTARSIISTACRRRFACRSAIDTSRRDD